MELTEIQKGKINSIGKKHDLRFIIIYGSYARGEEKKRSDLDLAVYGQEKITPEKLSEIFRDLSSVFGDNRDRALDIKSLHNTNPFFRFQVAKDGQLIYGSPDDYDEYHLYSYRNYNDSRSLLRLRDIMIDKRQKHLKEALKEHG
ncbi:MAG: nucleotidyltransferase domain-containing protein [Deltaproteobacteria bacterium]|nr:nucleotidyltransferase domain-containing protein [Deltaproteobacteria bacterium]